MTFTANFPFFRMCGQIYLLQNIFTWGVLEICKKHA